MSTSDVSASKPNTFGKVLRELRCARRLTQRALSELLGEHPGFRQISNYERGCDLPRHIDDVESLILALNCSAASRQSLRATYVQAILATHGIFQQLQN